MTRRLDLSFVGIAALIVAASLAVNVHGQTSEKLRVESVEIGFDGAFKLGHWTPVRIEFTGGSKEIRGTVDITTLDSDGVRTVYRTDGDEQVDFKAGSETTVLRYVKFGRSSGDVTVRVFDAEKTVLEHSFLLEREASAFWSTNELIVTVGQDVGVDDALQVKRRKGNANESALTATVEDVERLPDQWLGYEAIDAIVLPTHDLPRIESLTDQQIEALETWVQMGGLLVISVGKNGQELLGRAGRLARFVPGEYDHVRRLTKTVDLETYATAPQRLDTLPGADEIAFTSLKEPRGIIESRESNVIGQGPTIVRSSFGFGQVAFLAVDLDVPPISKWKGRGQLVSRLLRKESTRKESGQQDEASGRVAHEGYDDMVGQLRGTLDHFGGVTLVSFTVVATLIVVYLLLIGPGDYLLLNRVLGNRMELTWITLPVIVVTFCILTISLAYACKGHRLRINQIELVDLDAETSFLRGTVWSHVYSPRSEAYDLDYEPSLSARYQKSGVALSWQGLPGEGLGGMQNRSTAQLFSEPYAITQHIDSSGAFSASIDRMPIQVSSTKSLTGRWWGQLSAPVKSQLRSERHRDILQGWIANPLDVELRDCIVSYGSWMYRLDRKLGPGDTVDMSEMYERSLNLYLARRSVDNPNSPWDVTSRNVPRIMEMMMYHKAAGGRGYTNLGHRFQSFTDLSGHLDYGHAILTGWSEKRAGTLDRDEESLADNYDGNWNFYRIVFPVESFARPTDDQADR